MVKCMHCSYPALYIWWQRSKGYTSPSCTTCYPKSVAREGSEDWALALDGSKIYKRIEHRFNGITVRVLEWPQL
jgi:hypothetical protein